MRILHISTRLILGGSQENTVLSCEGQADLGHEVHLAYGPIYGPEGSLLDRVTNFRSGQSGQSITTHLIPHMVRELAPLKDRRALRECRQLIRHLKPDIVHTHSSKAGILGRFAGWKEGGQQSGRPGVIHTIHGLPFHPYNPRWRNFIYIRSERFAARRCHRIVTVCNAMTEQALAAGIGHRELFTTVYSGMETGAFLQAGVTRDQVRSELGIAPDDFIIGTVARLAELKGHDDLIDALGPVMKSNPHWKMLWVGDGWWRDRLVKRLKEHGIAQQVLLPGLVPPEQVPRFMRAMDILIHPSYREGLPRTAPQSLLSEVAVIVYNVDGAPEVCIDHETGILVKPGDLDALKLAAQWMFAHPSERRVMAERGRDLCADRFSAARMISDLEKVYTEVLNL